MKMKLHKAMLAAIAALALSSGITFAQSPKEKLDISADAPTTQEFVDNGSIVGSWYVSSSSPDRPPFKGMITFAEGGGMIASAQGDILLNINSLATAGHGAWVRTGNRTFLFTFRQIFYKPDGSYDGGIRVRHTATMKRNGLAWTGELTVEFFDVNDNIVSVGTGSGTATRITPLPLLP